MNDPEYFKMIMVKSLGVGNWGSSDAGDGIFDLFSKSVQFEVPWQTVVEEHYPLLQESIDFVNGGN